MLTWKVARGLVAMKANVTTKICPHAMRHHGGEVLVANRECLLRDGLELREC